MPRYIRLVRFTEEGVKNVEKLDDILVEARATFELNGGKVVDSFSTLGRYDLIAVVEAPDTETMMKISALIARTGYVRAETLPVVPTSDFAKSVAAERKPSRSRAKAAPTTPAPEKPPAKRKPSRPRAAPSATGRSRTRKPTPPPRVEESEETEEEGHTFDETED